MLVHGKVVGVEDPVGEHRFEGRKLELVGEATMPNSVERSWKVAGTNYLFSKAWAIVLIIR